MASKALPPKPGNPQSAVPNQTLYVKNLPDKLQKADLRRALYMLFSTYGPVLDIIALKTMKMRGQAHIVYRDTQSSAQALRALQGFEFFGKEMNISYAKGKSETIAKLDGTFKGPVEVNGTVSTDLQKSIFNAPPSGAVEDKAPTQAAPQTLNLPNGTSNGTSANEDPKSPQGVKRRREDESDDEEAPMEEDDEGEAMAMEESDED